MNRYQCYLALCCTAVLLPLAAGCSDDKELEHYVDPSGKGKSQGETNLAVPSGTSALETPAGQIRYYAVLGDGKRIGRLIQDFKIADEKAVTEIALQLRMDRGGMIIEIEQIVRTVETLDGKPLGFTYTIKQGSLGQTVEGRIDADGKLHKTYGHGRQKRTEVTDWPDSALLTYGAKLVMEEKGLKKGTTYTVRLFDPSLMSAQNMTVTVGARKKVDLLGRAVMLTEINSTLAVAGGSIEVTTYVDDKGHELKTVMSMLGMQMEVIACGKEVALAGNEVLDVLDRMVLASPRPLAKLARTSSVSYVMAPTSSRAKLKFLATDNQQVKAMPSGRVQVTVTPATAPKNAPLPYTGSDAQAAAALKPSQFVQSDDERILTLARQAVGDAKDAAGAARRIEKFVRGYISKKNLSVGYATAAEVAETREGDCTEHAVLTAAMCRAVGIPARVVTGIAYVSSLHKRRHVFAPHAWNEAYVGGKWIGLDAALGRYDAGHVALAHGDGNADGLFAVVNTLGNFRIVSIEIEPRR